MNNHEAEIFLFTIAKELKRSLEKPVILLTQKDYAEGIYNALVDMRSALMQKAEPRRVLDIVSAIHHEWLTAVADIDSFKMRLRNIPRDTIFHAIVFTRVCVLKRHKVFQKYIAELKSTMTKYEDSLIKDDLLQIADMQKSVLAVLLEKENIIRNTADAVEYYNKILDEIDELMNWLDSLNDSLAIEYSKVIGLKLPRLTSDLTKTFRQIMEEIDNEEYDDRLITKKQSRKQKVDSALRYCGIDDLEIKEIIKKINILQIRISKLKEEKSLAVTALEHKVHYLEEQLQSLQDLKTFKLKDQKEIDMKINKGISIHKTFHIFNHLLPAPDRNRIVEELISLWTNAIHISKDETTKSIISILSVTDMKRVFVDELGEFSIDKYGRKIYTVEADDCLYQRNENNKLVPLNDDDKHIYFYDQCGRYYTNNQEDRIYVAYENASEYRINSQNLLLKVSEMREGIHYYYDKCGKYYLDKNNKRIYFDDLTGRKYENDGFGNLVLIRNNIPNPFLYNAHLSKEGPLQFEENLYLQEVVGEALKKCIANVVMHQPADPVLFLAKCLEAYSYNQKVQQFRMNLRQEMMADRKKRRREFTDTPPQALEYEYEGTEVDENLLNYKSTEIAYLK